MPNSAQYLLMVSKRLSELPQGDGADGENLKCWGDLSKGVWSPGIVSAFTLTSPIYCVCVSVSVCVSVYMRLSVALKLHIVHSIIDQTVSCASVTSNRGCGIPCSGP